MKKMPKNPEIIIPIILIIIGLLVITAIFLLKGENGQEPGPGSKPGAEAQPHPQPEGEPWGGCIWQKSSPDVDYNFVSGLDFVVEKPVDKLEIKKDQEKRLLSLGKFRLPIETNTVLRIEKLWLYFFSEKLSDREDKLYGLEDSYLSKMILKVGDKTKEINLGKSGTHSFIELTDCPLGNIYPLNYETYLDFEFLLEIGCNNFQKGDCLNNAGKSLKYIDGADLTAQIRLFAISYQDLKKDLTIETEFKY